MKLRAGRGLSGNDTTGAPPVTVINNVLARREFPHGYPIGRRILARQIVPGKTEFGPEIAWEIVGVIVGERITGLGDALVLAWYARTSRSRPTSST